MHDSFHTRIPTLSDAALRNYLRFPHKYQTEAVAAAITELQKRGLDFSEFDPPRLLERLHQRDTEKISRPRRPGFLHDGTRPKLGRIRTILAIILVAGLCSAAMIYRHAAIVSASAIDLESPDSKKYLRDLEVIGGKANVLASDFRRAFLSLWEGKRLAGMVAACTLVLSTGFWVVSTRRE
jgi:hypothetical protein